VRLLPTHHVQHKRNEAVMRGERKKHFVNQHDVLEVVYHALAVKEIHRRAQEIPVQCLRESKTPGPRRYVRNGDHFFEADDLNGRPENDDIYVPGKNGAEEDGDHDESPYCAGDEGLLLLLKVRDLFGRFLRQSTCQPARSPAS